MAEHAVSVLNSNASMDEFGKLLNESWACKRSIFDPASNPAIEEIYQSGLNAGAIGGKLLGTESGGFMLFLVKPELRGKLCDRLKKLVCITFRLDFNGSKIVVYEPNNFQ